MCSTANYYIHAWDDQRLADAEGPKNIRSKLRSDTNMSARPATPANAPSPPFFHITPNNDRKQVTVMIASPPPSPITMPLTLPSVASVFVKLQRAKDRAKTDTLDFCSGDPQTHPCLFGEGTTPRNRVSLVHSDLFTCKGAVDVPKLLRASRASLLEKAEYLGGNILVEERCVFHGLDIYPVRWLTL